MSLILGIALYIWSFFKFPLPVYIYLFVYIALYLYLIFLQFIGSKKELIDEKYDFEEKALFKKYNLYIQYRHGCQLFSNELGILRFIGIPVAINCFINELHWAGIVLILMLFACTPITSRLIPMKSDVPEKAELNDLYHKIHNTKERLREMAENTTLKNKDEVIDRLMNNE